MEMWRTHVNVQELYSELDLTRTSLPSRRAKLALELTERRSALEADARAVGDDAEVFRRMTSVAEVCLA